MEQRHDQAVRHNYN